MFSYYSFNHRFKRSMLEITSKTSYDILWKYLDPLQKEKLPENIVFTIASGKKAYDIIRLYESGEYFFSQRVIYVLSKFIDMTDKCYPITIEGVETLYYVIYNLDAYTFINKDDLLFMYDPHFYYVQDNSLQIFGIKGTSCIIVSNEIKNALLKNKITNIELIECFGCSLEEYKEIKKSKFKPEVHAYRDR